jgi:hypothetical protein
MSELLLCYRARSRAVKIGRKNARADDYSSDNDVMYAEMQWKRLAAQSRFVGGLGRRICMKCRGVYFGSSYSVGVEMSSGLTLNVAFVKS